MHILIVEDERLALDDLLSMLQPLTAAHSLIGCAGSDEALAQAEQQRPDLVITDIRMPGMSGLELVRRLKANNPLLAAIILSGHSEFEYAREGMRLGIADYLLKPVRTDMLLQAVERALAQIIVERAQAAQVREAHLVRLLFGGPGAVNADQQLLAGSWGLIIVVCENWESPVLWRDTALDRAAFAKSLADDRFDTCDIVGIDGHIRVVLVPLKEQLLQALESAARHLHRMIIHAGVIAHTTYMLKPANSSPGTLVPDILQRLAQAMCFGAPTFLQTDTLPEVQSIPEALEQLRLLERSLSDGKPFATMAQLHAILNQMQQAQATQPTLVDTLDQYVQILRKYTNPAQSEALPSRSMLVAVLRRLRSYDELIAWLDPQIMRLLERQRGAITPRQLVHSLVLRLGVRYADDISLQEFVNENGVSLAYFSRLFKDEVGMTFSDYLTQVRVGKAKELLERGDLRLGDISALVGYDDPKYFSQVFRRVVGMTPLDYQRNCHTSS